jgi:signal transduction histidine kinase
MSLTALLLRDFLLDSKTSSEMSRSDLDRLREETSADLSRLDALVPRQQSAQVATLRREVDQYLKSLDPLFTSDPTVRARLGFSFIQNEVVPRRRAALQVVSELEELNAQAFKQRRSDIDARNSGLASYVARTLGLVVLIAVVIAVVSAYRIYKVERTAELEHEQVQATEDELRKLSRQLVTTQEGERRALSRDLHDQVGQVLTALRISLANLEAATATVTPQPLQEWQLAKRLLAQALRSTRDIAMGLRPAMLDDLGLEAALEWHARQHAKICGTPVNLEISGNLAHLSDAQRICIYRMVQEGLNNAAKYAQANNITVRISSVGGTIEVDIVDDGVGFAADSGKPNGLGLLGIRERVAQLGGTLAVKSGALQGTSISARFPANQQVA